MEASSKEKEFIQSQNEKETEWISFDAGRICQSRIEVSDRADMTDKREKSLVKQKVKEERMTEQRILVLKKKKEARAWIAFHAKQDSTAVTPCSKGRQSYGSKK